MGDRLGRPWGAVSLIVRPAPGRHWSDTPSLPRGCRAPGLPGAGQASRISGSPSRRRGSASKGSTLRLRPPCPFPPCPPLPRVRTHRLAPHAQARPVRAPPHPTHAIHFGGGRVRGEPIGTNFGTPITISAPPSPPSPAWPCPPKGQGQAWGGRAGRGAAYHGHTEIRTHRLAPYARRPPPHPAHGNLAGIARPCTR